MKLITTFGLTIILVILAACSNTKNDKNFIVERLVIPKTKPEKLYNLLRPESQKFQINVGIDNIITGKNGTQVFVPKNSFINADGKIVKGKVDIEIIEVLSVADFVKTNLQTVCNDKPLQSEGMLYIDAKIDDEQITLAKEKKLQVELPKLGDIGNVSDIKIFSGSYNSNGNINWNESGKIENKLIPLPLDLFEYSCWISYNFERRPNNDGYTIYKYDLETEAVTDSSTFKQKKYENTFIATREFEKRFDCIKKAESAIGDYTSYYSTTIKRGRIINDSTISKIYLNNINKDLWYCDSLAYAYMKTWLGKAKFNSYWFSEIKKTNLLNIFEQFYKQRLTSVVAFPPDIDLRKNNAREKLASKGYTELEIDQIIGAYERQKKIVNARLNREKAQRISTNSFTIAKLGWINCDQFYNEPSAKESNILASVNNLESYEYAALTLIINGRRIALNGFRGDNSQFTFTGMSKPYTRLPIGEKATIVGISYKNDKPFLGIKEIVITDKGNYELDLQASSIEEISSRLKAVE